MLRRRWVRELRYPPLAGRSQRLRWVDGERLVVTRPFWRQCGGVIPAWLAAAATAVVVRPTESVSEWHAQRVVIRQFPPAGLMRRWWNWFRGRHVISAGPRLGGLMFRRERLGKPGPRPLAFGQRPDGGSFILFEPDAGRGPDGDE
jgi:hypothetical protein